MPTMRKSPSDNVIYRPATRIVPAERIRILTGAALSAPIAAAVPALGREAIMVEPQARGTATGGDGEAAANEDAVERSDPNTKAPASSPGV